MYNLPSENIMSKDNSLHCLNKQPSVTATQYRNKRLLGITLIEVLIVVVIIGILASMSMPYYRIYYVRSDIGDLLETFGHLKTPVLEFFNVEQRCPKGDDISLGIIQWVGNENTDCKYKVEFDNPEVTGTLVFQYGPDIWGCVPGTTIPAKYLPKSCKTGAYP